MITDGKIEKAQGALLTFFGGGQLVFYSIIANALSGMFPAWHLVIWAVAGLLGLEALIMLIVGLVLLYIGVKA